MILRTVLRLFVLSLLVSFTCACDSDPEEECRDYSACDVSANNCITDEDGNGYFTYGGNKYPYNLDNVADVQKELLKEMCPTSSQAYIDWMYSELNTETLQFINEARTAAICQ